MKPKTVNADKYFFEILIELVDGWLRFIVERLRRWGLGEPVPPLQMPHPVGLVIWIQQDFKINTDTIYTLYMFLFKEIARECMRDIMSYITNSNIIDVKLCGT